MTWRGSAWVGGRSGLAGGGTKIQTMTAPAATGAELRQRAGLQVLTWPVFDRLPVDAMVTTRYGGVSSGGYATLNLSLGVGDAAADVLENRHRVAAALGADLTAFVFASQVHGADARIVSGADRGRGARDAAGAVGPADALVTADPGTVLTILVADCVPVVLYDPVAHVLACVHAGWRGTVARATRAALTAMRSLGASAHNVIAGIGPAISPGAYRVGQQVADAAGEAFGRRAGPLLRPAGPGQWLFDLWAANRQTLRDAGVPDGQIHLAAMPTGPDPGLFFSHRAEQPCGRFALVARLTGAAR
jgi:polyphenol oxidase